MNRVIFSLGTNIGDRLAHLEFATANLSQKLGRLILKSNIYQTKAWGHTAQDDFFNQCILVETNKTAHECLFISQDIENQRDRIRDQFWGPRTLDIDILFFNKELINSSSLKIPHPYIDKRKFVLLPLNEICPYFIHPILDKNVSELLALCFDNSKCTKLN